MNDTRFFPRRLSFEKLCEILVSYLNAGGDKEHIGVSEVVQKSNVTLHNISRNNNFFKSWNFIEESDKELGKYILSRDAAEFAYAYKIDPKGNRTKEILKRLLEKNEDLTKFVERIKRENLSREAIFVELPRVISDLRVDKVGLNAFLDMIAYTFQIEDIITLRRTIGLSRDPRKTVRATKYAGRASPRIAVSPRPNISLNLTLTPEITPERLRSYIKAMLEAYDEYRREKQ